MFKSSRAEHYYSVTKICHKSTIQVGTLLPVEHLSVSCLYRECLVQGPVTALSGPRGLSDPVLYPVWGYVE